LVSSVIPSRSLAIGLQIFCVVIGIFTVEVGYVNVRAKYVEAWAGSMWLKIGTSGIHL